MKLYDNLSNNPVHITDKKIKIYVCGPTIYDNCHLGHGRMLVVFDVLHRVCKKYGDEVIFVQNITDIDDKIINKSKELNITPNVLTENYYESFLSDCKNLNILKPTHQPKATDYLNKMITYIENLLEKNKAYITTTGIYLDTTSIDYGYFEIKENSISRVEHEDKKNPKDFALWKFKDDYYYTSPWGNGRPGWHLECSVMSNEFLGDYFTIHGGGADLKFPHHENEIAQSIAFCNHGPCKIWMHNEMINVDNSKMSKSLNNFKYLNEYVISSFYGDVLRYLYLSYSYDTLINFTEDKLLHSEEALITLRKYYFQNLQYKTTNLLEKDHSCYSDLYDNLNTSITIKNIFKYAKENKWIEFYSLIDILGFKMDIRSKITTKEIEENVKKLNTHRENKNFLASDKIRDFLYENYVFIINGTDNWYYF